MIITDVSQKLTPEQIKEAIQDYEGSQIFNNICIYADYYEGRNPDLYNKVADRAYRKKTPNWYIPTPYFSTTVDGMAGIWEILLCTMTRTKPHRRSLILYSMRMTQTLKI